MTVTEIFDKGGVVVTILFVYSVIALAIVLERYLHFLRMGRLPTGFSDGLQKALQDGGLKQLIDGIHGPEAAVIKGLLHAQQQGINDLIRVATRIGSRELQRMERGFRTLGLLGDTAPLLGLFGTIIGMIKAFMIIEQVGGKVDAQALAGGIWEAMITTGVGLAVALPILFLLHWLEGLAERRTHSMQYFTSLMLESTPHKGETAVTDNIHHREDLHYGV